jgi:hypothetical protein
MTRKYLAALTAILAVAAVSVITGTGCSPSGVGDPCIPEAEYAADFLGFDEHEVNVESKSFQCQTRLCLVNHFRGRVSCPYGQNATANGPDQGGLMSTFKCSGQGAPNSENSPCCLPGVDQPVISDQDEASNKGNSPMASDVPANCTDRTADKAVYCSCRCANIDGQTNDGANYCSCPNGFSCTQLITPIGQANAQLTGAYCIRNNTAYSQASSCQDSCNPTIKSGNGYCGPANTAQF